MLVLLIVIAAVVLLAVVLSFGGGFGGPVVHRRVGYRRPTRRVITEHHVIEDSAVADPIDRPVYRP